MKTLPGFWHAAARMSGRINFGSLFDSKLAGHPIEERSISQLIDGGIRAQDARILRNTAPLDINVQWLTIGDEDYPSSLKHVPYAPPVLFYEGNIQRLNAPALAVVGARRCSVPGEAWAMTFSRRAVQAGVVIVSGLAQGIDSAAHRAAAGATIAVLGHGLNAPMSRIRFARCQDIIRQGGLLVSEFLPHFPPSRWTFPQRNRVIAGLAKATLVIEAGTRSGSLITARNALDIGRDVWAVPGHPSQPLALGCLQLLRDGAQLIGSVQDLEDALGIGPLPVSAQNDLVDQLQDGMTVEMLAEQSGLPVSSVHIELSRAVMLGLAKRLPGNRFRRA